MEIIQNNPFFANSKLMARKGNTCLVAKNNGVCYVTEKMLVSIDASVDAIADAAGNTIEKIGHALRGQTMRFHNAPIYADPEPEIYIDGLDYRGRTTFAGCECNIYTVPMY